jgi:hypothetical protein
MSLYGVQDRFLLKWFIVFNMQMAIIILKQIDVESCATAVC